MRLRRLRRADGSMEANGLPMYVVKRPNYLTTLRSVSMVIHLNISVEILFFFAPLVPQVSTNFDNIFQAFDEIMSNSICTVAGRLVPCIREPST